MVGVKAILRECCERPVLRIQRGDMPLQFIQATGVDEDVVGDGPDTLDPLGGPDRTTPLGVEQALDLEPRLAAEQELVLAVGHEVGRADRARGGGDLNGPIEALLARAFRGVSVHL